MKNWSKVKSTGTATDPDNMNDEIANMQKEAQASTSRGGKKKANPLARGIPILEQTISILPTLYRSVEKVDNKSLPLIMDDFLRELCRYFSTFVQFVQPAQFWNKYRPTTKKKAKPKPDESSESDNDSDGEGGRTITTMESACLQNNLSDEDFDDV